jgi:hypothetical protein
MVIRHVPVIPRNFLNIFKCIMEIYAEIANIFFNNITITLINKFEEFLPSPSTSVRDIIHSRHRSLVQELINISNVYVTVLFLAL